MSDPLTVAVLPRDPNPYQGLLYAAMAHDGVRAEYLGRLTPSHTLNLLLLPLEVLWRHGRGASVVHVHWVYGFRFPGAGRSRLVRRLGRAWFALVLGTVRRSGARLVWTVHNVLPHEQVFDDDLAGRRMLVSAADLVLVHSPATKGQLAALGLNAREVAVVPHGPYPQPGRPRAAAADDRLRFTFVGAVAPYKGVVELVAAFASLAVDLPARLVVAGACEDVDYAARLRAACAAAAGPPVQLRLGRLTDAELDALLADSDVLVLPYLEVTTSGSAVLGLGAGLPLLVPDLPGLADLPGAAVLRYPPGDLAAALARVVATSRAELVRMGESGRATVAAHPWSEVATRTAELYRGLVRTAAPG